MKPIEIGQKLGQYGILDRLGAGGMGEVYVAEDPSLKRLVALKVLPPEVSSFPDRQQRFEQEARTIAALNHPNIVTVYSVEQADDQTFMTMELVQGRRLTEYLGGPIPFNDFMRYALPLCEAVDAAHGAGITHRDLKPDNVMVTNDGHVKVLDFGVAKVAAEDDAGLTEMRTSATVTGEVVGTVTHMSPEQAQGMVVDTRTDIFSLGVIFYEMLSGERPFDGDNAAMVISAILRDEPNPVRGSVPELPRGVDRIVGRCLDKAPQRRFQSVRDVVNELEYVNARAESGNDSDAVAAVAPGGSRLSPALAAAMVLPAAVLGAAVMYLVNPLGSGNTEPTGVVEQVTSQPMEELFPSLAPDGQNVVYANRARGVWDIYLLRVGGQRAINLTEDGNDDDTQPAYSPDGQSIAFRSERDGGGLYVMGATGEAVRRLTNAGYNPTWSPDGAQLAYSTERVTTVPSARTPPASLHVVDIATGQSSEVRPPGSGVFDAVQPAWSPDGNWIAYWTVVATNGHRDIQLISPDGGNPVAITNDAALDWNPVFAPDGDLYFVSDRGGTMNVWRVQIDSATGAPQGEPTPVTVPSPWVAHLTFAGDTGAMAYASVQQIQNVHRVEPNDDGLGSVLESRPIPTGTIPVTSPHVSADGEWLTMQSWGVQEDLFRVRTDGTGFNQLTDDIARDRRPRWSPDGSRLAFYSNRGGKHEIWTINADASGLRQITFSAEGMSANFPVWSPDGQQIGYYVRHDNANYVVNANANTRDEPPTRLPDWDGEDEHFGIWSWSPDGRWLAGSLRGPEGTQIGGVVVLELSTGTYRRLTDFGEYPEWLPDSSGVAFQTVRPADRVYVVDLAGGEPRLLVDAEVAEFAAHTYGGDTETMYIARKSIESDVWLRTSIGDEDL